MPSKRLKNGSKVAVKPSKVGLPKGWAMKDGWPTTDNGTVSLVPDTTTSWDEIVWAALKKGRPKAKGWTSASKRIEHRMARLGIDPLAPATAKGHLARGKARHEKAPARTGARG